MMTLSSLNKCGLILLVLVLGLSLLGYTPLSEGEEDTLALPNSRQKNREGRETISRMFEIKNLDINEAKEKVQGLLTKDENIKASVEIVTVRRGDETVNFLVVKDTPVNIEQISQVLEKLEQEFAPLTVKMNFSDVPLNQILSTIAQSTDLNIIGGEALAQKVSVHLKDVPLADVFDIILKSS